MKPILLIPVLAAAALAQTGGQSSFNGRWDLTVHAGHDTYPSWVEVTGAPDAPKVRVVGRVASAHPATDVKLSGASLLFSTEEWFGKTMQVKWDLRVKDGAIAGTYSRADGVNASFEGKRAPSLNRTVRSWGSPQPLFNGTDMSGWEPFTTEPGKVPESHWKADGGDLLNVSPGANIRTTRTFNDFKLHVEFNCPDEGNSGIYLRGRDEIQVAYEKGIDALHGMGALYGFIAPSVSLPWKPGQWETFDITLVGRKLTVVRDGQTTINAQEIPGITGGAIDSHEGEPGPIYLQGDHTGGMRYRNITIAQPR
jgi:hypothetical protein